jgi:hypothetical protein
MTDRAFWRLVAAVFLAIVILGTYACWRGWQTM